VLRAHPAYRLIVDLRNNLGGDSGPFQSLINDIQADPAVNRPGRVIALINDLTFSSATLDSYFLSHRTRAVLIGQQAADTIDEYGDDHNLLRLPYGGLSIYYTTTVINPFRTRYGIPDIVVTPTVHDLLTGYDPGARRRPALRPVSQQAVAARAAADLPALGPSSSPALRQRQPDHPAPALAGGPRGRRR
jgi:hypothetical protein